MLVELRKIGVYIAVWLLTALLLPACKEEKSYRIGVSQCSSDDWREKMNDEILREAMFHDDISVEIRSADDDNARQIADIRYFADNGFDIVIVAPNEAEAITPIVKEVYERGIPVLVFDRNINGDTYTAYQGVDNVGLGISAAHYARQMVGAGSKAIEIYGLKGSTPARERHEGFVEGLAKEGGIKLQASEYADWNEEDAVRVADSLLSLYPDVDLIYAHNDRMAIGASKVAKAHGLDNIRIIGIDAAPNIGIQAVADGVIDATFLYPTEGHRLVRTAMAILKGEPYERHVLLPVSSAVDLSNADILLLQNESLKEETRKMELLKNQVDDFWNRYSAQTALLYAVVVILVLLTVLIFILLRSYWSIVRHRKMLNEQNRQLEQQRDELNHLYEQLQHATQSKLVFFTNVSHDLRTPLTLIADPVEQLAAADNLTDRQHTLMQLANKNVKILMRLINQILDFRKYENGKLSLVRTETDLAAAVAEWVASFRHVTLKRHIRLSLTTEPDRDYTLAVDVEKMERIFFNLLSNAVKYTPENGEIRVALSSDGERLTVTVSDTGTGMTEENLRNIFERFYQADHVHANGSGIGLALVKSFVELHGGAITAQSEPGKGTVFTFTLPVTHVEERSESGKLISEEQVSDELTDVEAGDTEPNEKSKTVLIIDDNADIRQLVRSLLADDYSVIQAANGLQGIKLASKYIPDMIICDVMMPGIDGMETCRRLKAEMITSHIPVLMLTACSMDEQRIEGYACGADAYLAKPFDSRLLLARCDALILNRKRIQQALSSEISAPRPVPVRPAESYAAAPKPSDPDNEFYRRFVGLVEKEMSDSELSVEDLASRMGMSRIQFYRKLKALTNFSPVELLRILRLKRADVLLKTTEDTVSEISYSVGFSSPSYFTKCYRDYFGEAPTEVQKRTSKITHK